MYMCKLKDETLIDRRDNGEIKPLRSQNKALFHARPFSALIQLSAITGKWITITGKCVRWDESLLSVIVHPAFRSLSERSEILN